MHHAVVERTAPPVLVHHLYLHHCHIGTVGFHSLGIADDGESQVMGISGSGQRIATAIIGHRLQGTGLEGHVLEGMQVAHAPLALAQRTAIEQQFHLVGIRHHQHILHRSLGIVPMSDDIGAWLFVVHPSRPHHLMGVERIFGDTHGIDNTAHTVVGLATVVGVGVAEHDFHATAAHTPSGAWPLEPVLIPPAHHLDGKAVHVVVVVGGQLTPVERSVTLLVEGIALLVPVLAQTLVAAVFHGPHGVLARLVDIEHLAAILRLVDVEHLARADGPATAGVVSVADGLELEHVLTADTLVATLVEEDTGVVAVVDDGVAHELGALGPPWSLHVFLGIAGRHGLWQSHAVARLHILFPRRDVHPSHHIGS